VVAPGNNISQELFVASCRDGSQIKLVRLNDGRCALYRAGEAILYAGCKDSDIDFLVAELLKLVDED
jgi:hypothetical protein